MARTLWVDVEDLFCYKRANARPSGIQRVAFEISQALRARSGNTGMVRFIRYDPVRDSFRTVKWSEIADIFTELTEAEPPPKRPPSASTRTHSRAREFVRKVVYRLPETLRDPVTEMLVAQERAFHAWARLCGALARDVIRSPRRLARWRDRRKGNPTHAPDPTTKTGFADQVAQGDTLLTLGAPWSQPDYAALIERHRKRFGLRYALVVYDVIPLRRPEWCEHGLVRAFRAFFNSLIPMCDTVLAISHATATDIETCARERGIRLSGPVVPIPMGSGFSAAPGVAVTSAAAMPRADRLPPAGSYALLVSTIEVRKNHVLMFRVWRRLLEEMPSELVPTLVFAGRVGWLVEDLMRQIANADHLDGKLVVVEDPSDAELAALYQGCQFTVFPSLYEGWGLPVTESLAFGKPCLIADRTSLPEAGGALARRFDPDNLNDAFAAIRDVILDPKGLARWEARVRRDFLPVPWSDSADALLAALEYPEPRKVIAGTSNTHEALTETGASR
jgi:glycosyltransferase involved in cell wall biosynthesis